MLLIALLVGCLIVIEAMYRFRNREVLDFIIETELLKLKVESLEGKPAKRQRNKLSRNTKKS